MIHIDDTHFLSSRTCGHDITPDWRTGEKELPFLCKAIDQHKQVRVPVGRIPAGAKVTLKLIIAEGKAEELPPGEHTPAIFAFAADRLFDRFLREGGLIL